MPNSFQHEIATSYIVRDQVLAVLTSCSHRGVLSSARQAVAASGVTRLDAVAGGHLPPLLDDGYVRRTVAEMRAMSRTR